MDKSQKIMSDFIVYSKYAKYIPELKRRETFDEICDRYHKMMADKFRSNKFAMEQLSFAMKYVRERKVLPSMRMAQFSGNAISKNNARGYNCFSRDTQFITQNGVKSFYDFNSGDTITVLTHTGEWKNATVNNHGTQELYEIGIKKGNSKIRKIKATKDHTWILNNGIRTNDVQIGDYLYPAPMISDFDFEDATIEEKLYWCYGFIYGDGTITKKNGIANGSIVRLCGKKIQYLERFSQLGFKSSQSLSIKSDIFVYTGRYMKTLPDLNIDSPSLIKAFIDGILHADGSKNYNNKTNLYASIQATGNDTIEFLRNALPVSGYYIVREDDFTSRSTNYGDRSDTTIRFAINPMKFCKTNSLWKVVSIDKHINDEVWCLSVDDNHSFVLSVGVSTGNCSYLAIDHLDAFSEVMFLLLSGCGVGYSVQSHHIDKLPEITRPTRSRKFLVGDQIEGWADAIKSLFSAYFKGKANPVFDFSDIRAKDTVLVTSGGKAPGPQPLKDCIYKIRTILDSKQNGEKLSSLEIHEIICFIADCVLVGGIRRASCIVFFDIDDTKMLTCKSGNWYETKPHLGRANNSPMMVRHKVKKEDFDAIFNQNRASGFGEPSPFFSNHEDHATNPCQPKWAKILTADGIKEMKDISIGEFIWSSEGWCRVINKFSTGIKDVYKYRTNAGIFYGTENHRLVSNGEKIEASLAKSCDIICGPELTDIIHNEQDIMDGLVFGDGSVHKASNNLVYLIIGEKDHDYFDSEIKHQILKHRPGLKNTAYEIETTITNKELVKTYNRRVPSRYFENSKILGFLRGLFTANGTVNKHRVCLKTSSLGLAEDVQMMLNSIGIKNYITTNKSKEIKFSNGTYRCKESYDVNISGDYKKFIKYIGFIQKYKIDKLNRLNKTDKNRHKKTYDIISKEYVSTEEVFDITVDNISHTYWTQCCNVSNCGEIALQSCQFCNLTTINGATIESQEDLNNRVKAAAILGTFQATFTDFHYLREVWKKNTEKDSLLGISMTGIAANKWKELVLSKSVKLAIAINGQLASELGINRAKRITTVKPEGSSSLVLGTSSGIHAYYAPFYLRRVRLGKDEACAKYLIENYPDLIEQDLGNSKQVIFTLPMKSPENSITRTEGAIELLERIKFFNEEWIAPGHIKGENKHNVSSTVEVKEDEWDVVQSWMWNNRNSYNGITVLPYNGGNYIQAPFEEITEERFNEMFLQIQHIDFSKITEEFDTTNLIGEVACGGQGCNIT